MGGACHVDLNASLRLRRAQLKRIKRMLARLCGLDKDMLDGITDFGEGLTLMHMHMKREPVFLAIDNVTNNNSSWDEAYEYLMAGFHPESRIVITSRSISNIEGLVPDIRFCVPMPRLSVTEAGELFLRSAAPSKSIFGLTAEERRIVGLCIQQCLFKSDQGQVGCDSDEDEVGFLLEGDVHSAWKKSYHPVALSALGDFFRRYFSNSHMLRWKDYLEEKKDPLWDLWKVPNGIGRIIGLQFHSLPPSERLLFLDIVTFTQGSGYPPIFPNDEDKFCIEWLCKVHAETWPVMERRLQDLERSGMIMFDRNYFGEGSPRIRGAHDIYRRFAEWFVTNHGVKWLTNAWCIFNTPGSTLKQDHVASNLVRLRMFNLTGSSARLFASKSMQELHNLEVLQLHSCPSLTELNLEGRDSVQDLELVELRNLVVVTLIGSPSTVETGGIFGSLQFVVLRDLDSLVHGPDVRSCTSLHGYYVESCPSMTNLDGMECPHLKDLLLQGLVAHQLARLPNVRALQSLKYFYFSSACYVDICDVEASREVRLRDLGQPYLRVVEEFSMYLRTEWFADDRLRGLRMYILWRKWKSRSEYLEWSDPRGGYYRWGYP